GATERGAAGETGVAVGADVDAARADRREHGGFAVELGQGPGGGGTGEIVAVEQRDEGILRGLCLGQAGSDGERGIAGVAMDGRKRRDDGGAITGGRGDGGSDQRVLAHELGGIQHGSFSRARILSMRRWWRASKVAPSQ